MSTIKRVSSRINTKIGEVYLTKETKKGKRYFQFVAIDLLELSSDVIVVFNASVSEEEIRNKAISTLPIEFYHHTTVSRGVKEGLWVKVGRAEPPGLSKLIFKEYYEKFYEDIFRFLPRWQQEHYPNWKTWSPTDKKRKKLSEDRGKKLEAESGGVVPPDDIIYRIEHGKSRFKSNWPTD